MMNVLDRLRATRRGVQTHGKRIWRQVLSEPLNRGHRASLLRDYIDWHLRYKYRGRRWTIRFENGLKSYVYPYPDHDAGELNIWTTNVDFHDLRLARSVLEPGDFIVDAGCNVGNRTLALADIVSGALLIDANPTAVRRARENVALNGLDTDRFAVLEAAVGQDEGEALFTDLGGANTGNRIVAGQSESTRVRRVPLTTIDAEVARRGERPAFIKVDVEGHDYQALLGARRTLESGSVRLVTFERDPREPLAPFTQLFDSMRWKLFALDENGRATDERTIIERRLNLFATPLDRYAMLKSFGWD